MKTLTEMYSELVTDIRTLYAAVVEAGDDELIIATSELVEQAAALSVKVN